MSSIFSIFSSKNDVIPVTPIHERSNDKARAKNQELSSNDPTNSNPTNNGAPAIVTPSPVTTLSKFLSPIKSHPVHNKPQPFQVDKKPSTLIGLDKVIKLPFPTNDSIAFNEAHHTIDYELKLYLDSRWPLDKKLDTFAEFYNQKCFLGQGNNSTDKHSSINGKRKGGYEQPTPPKKLKMDLYSYAKEFSNGNMTIPQGDSHIYINEDNQKFNQTLAKDSKPKMYLEYLLPLITLTEEVSSDQYKQIDEFLMPIWTFNQITAKDFLDKDTMSAYVDVIKSKKGKGVVKKKLLDKILQQLIEKKPKSLGLHNGVSDETKEKIKEKIKYAAKRMNKTFHDKDYSDTFRLLYGEFLNSCIQEKSVQREDEAHVHRINSGGCKLMVQGVSDSLGIGDPKKLINELSINDIFANEIGLKNDWKKKVDKLLILEGEANILFNDPISLFKEVTIGEIDQPLSSEEYYDLNECENSEQKIKEKIDQWFTKKMAAYEKCLLEFRKQQSNLMTELSLNCEDDETYKKLCRYIDLISVALLAVPLWSCELTHRYFLNDSTNSEIYIRHIESAIQKINDARKIHLLQLKSTGYSMPLFGLFNFWEVKEHAS